MRKELSDIESIENFLFRTLNDEEEQLFRVRLLLEPELEEKLNGQKKIYRLIRLFSHDEQRFTLDRIYQRLLKEEEFRYHLRSLFPGQF